MTATVRFIDLPDIEVLPVTFVADCLGKVSRMTKSNRNYKHQFKRTLAFALPTGRTLVLAASCFSRTPNPDFSDMVRQMFNFAQNHAEARRARPTPAAAPNLGPAWTDDVRRACVQACAEQYGDPPCWRLPQLSCDVKAEAVQPCDNCLSWAAINQRKHPM